MPKNQLRYTASTSYNEKNLWNMIQRRFPQNGRRQLRWAQETRCEESKNKLGTDDV